MNALRIISRTKLYWGLAIICLIGALASPHTSAGRNIFLSYNNLTDVLRQVSITGLVATGMTIVILLGGIDLSVGSVMGCSTIVCAMLLTKPGWTPAAIMGVPAATIAIGLAVGFLARFVFNGLARGRDVDAGRRREIVLGPWRGYRIPGLLGLAAGAAVAAFTASQVPTKFGVLAVLLVTPCFSLMLGSINGALIVKGRLQPFIATLAMMVSALGIGRLTAGQDNAVIAVYTGTNATEAFEILRSMVWGLIPMPSIFFSPPSPRSGQFCASPPSAATSMRSAATWRRRSFPASRSRRSSSPPTSFHACWLESQAFFLSRSIGRENRMQAPAWNSTRSPPSSSAERA